jgi:hypothetical protein
MKPFDKCFANEFAFFINFNYFLYFQTYEENSFFKKNILIRLR